MGQEVFTQDQKAIINRVRSLTYGGRFLGNVIDPEMYNSRIQVDFKNKRAFILIEKPVLTHVEYEKYVMQQTFNWINYLIDISFVLLDVLVEFKLAKTHRPPDIKEDIFTFGPGAINRPTESFEITDPQKVQALLNLSNIQVEISTEIDELI